ncbi:MAG: tripartite tricarboxylate transporter TctB family protein [Burkholderiales bacterium]
MKLNDAVWGALLLLFATAILVHIQAFGTIPGQQYGPALYPGVIAVGLAVCGVMLIVSGLAARTPGPERSAWVVFAPWTRSQRHVLAFALAIGVNVFYVLLADKLGFIPTGVIYLAVLFTVFGVPARWILPLAVVMTLVIHTAFYKLLRVPLPWGVLQKFLW